MRLIEGLAAGLVAMGLLFKFLHWPMAGVLLIIPSSLLMLLYFPAGFAWFGRPRFQDQRYAVSIVAGLAFAVAIMGFLFRMQHWPLAGFHVLLGSMLCVSILIAQLILRGKRPELAAYERALLWRTLIITTVVVALQFTHARTLINLQYHDDPDYAALMIRSTEHPEDTAARNALDRYRMERMRGGR